MEDNKNKDRKYTLSFAALDPYVESHTLKPIENVTARGFVSWGERNEYPQYLFNLYNSVATLKSIIDGLVDYVCGDDVILNIEQFSKYVNHKGETFGEIFHKIVLDYAVYGGYALNIVKNKIGGIAEIHYLDFKHVRSNEDHTMFQYSKDWSKSYGRVKYVEYPAYSDEKTNYNSIFYFSNDGNKTYPTPIYGASLIACEIEKSINEYHLNSINNSFAGNIIVNFNNGQPSDEQKEEIEDAFYEKYTGFQNGNRPVLVFNDSKENAVTIEKIDVDDFSERYQELSKRSKQELFTAFRATPNLFGIMTETTGFSEQEFAESFKLFNRTMVMPIQKKFKQSLEKVFGEGTLSIKPFTIEFN